MAMHSERKRLTAIDYRFSDLDYKKASSISNKMAMHSEVLAKGAHEPTEGKRLQHNSNRLQIQ